MSDLLAAAKRVLFGLEKRIAQAPLNAKPVFDGMAALSDAIVRAESADLPLAEIAELRSDARQYAAEALSPTNRQWYQRVAEAFDILLGDVDAADVAKVGWNSAIEACAQAACRISDKYSMQARELWKKPGEAKAVAAETAADEIEAAIRALRRE
jgi:hypothetical protein